MNVTYQREVSHCEVSPYVKEVTISLVEPAANSDFLDRVHFEELGWQCLSQKGLRHVGEKVLFIPAESVLPFELGELLEITKHLSKGRVRVARLRGNRSEGVIVEKELVEPYLPYILKWEDLPSVYMQGEMMAASEISPHMHRFHKMPNILNEPYTFEVGEELWFSEKLHGSSFRTGLLRHPITEETVLYAGSHNVVLRQTEREPIYWRAAKEVANRLPQGILFFGEVYGRGIQHLTYGVDFGYRFFAASIEGQYIPHEQLVALCNKHSLPCVEFYSTTFTNLEDIRALAEGTSAYANHIKEGIVLVSKRHPERMAKCISSAYLESSNRTERH